MQGNAAAIAHLQDLMRTLVEAGLSPKDATNRCFDLAFILAPYVDIESPEATPHESARYLKAATLLKAASLQRLPKEEE